MEDKISECYLELKNLQTVLSLATEDLKAQISALRILLSQTAVNGQNSFKENDEKITKIIFSISKLENDLSSLELKVKTADEDINLIEKRVSDKNNSTSLTNKVDILLSESIKKEEMIETIKEINFSKNEKEQIIEQLNELSKRVNTREESKKNWSWFSQLIYTILLSAAVIFGFFHKF